MSLSKVGSNHRKGKKLGPMSLDHKNKISIANKGKKRSEDQIARMRIISTGRKYSDESKRKRSERMSGVGHPMFGKKHAPESIKKMSLAKKGIKRPFQQGDKSHFWKGGVTPANKLLRQSLEFRLWRTAVFTRDNFTCVWCGQRGGRIEPDHIKQFAYYPELRFAIDNGRTLCHECHKKTDNYGHKGVKRT